MRKTMLAVAAVSTLAFAAQAALAEESCAGSGTPMTKGAVETQLKAQGYTQIREIKSHGGCYEAKGLDHPRIWTAERDTEMWAALET